MVSHFVCIEHLPPESLSEDMVVEQGESVVSVVSLVCRLDILQTTDDWTCVNRTRGDDWTCVNRTQTYLLLLYISIKIEADLVRLSVISKEA